jgi:hypothetical protein
MTAKSPANRCQSARRRDAHVRRTYLDHIIVLADYRQFAAGEVAIPESFRGVPDSPILRVWFSDQKRFGNDSATRLAELAWDRYGSSIDRLPISSVSGRLLLSEKQLRLS